jgi:carboxylate-amine ligase
LRSHVAEILEEGKMLLGEQIKPKMIQSMVEGRHGYLPQRSGSAHDITRLAQASSPVSRRRTGLAIVAASTHPISHWQDQKIFDDERYELASSGTPRQLLGSLLIFGLPRTRRHGRSRARIPDHERRALLPAARACALDVLARSG